MDSEFLSVKEVHNCKLLPYDYRECYLYKAVQTETYHISEDVCLIKQKTTYHARPNGKSGKFACYQKIIFYELHQGQLQEVPQSHIASIEIDEIDEVLNRSYHNKGTWCEFTSGISISPEEQAENAKREAIYWAAYNLCPEQEKHIYS